MAITNVYLTFDGNCKEAFTFYQSVFNGEFRDMNTYADMPAQEGMPPTPDEHKNKIMHVALPISKETMIMGADAVGEWGGKLTMGNNYAISVNTDKQDEGERIFNELSKGGSVKMPFEKTFWNAYFGMFTDKFGVHWMVNCDMK